MKCFGRKAPGVQKEIKRDYFSRLLLDLKVSLDLNDEEFHNLCGILVDQCPMNIFQGGKIDNLGDYVIHLECRSPKKVLAKALPLSITIDRVQKESSFPFNLNELFIEYADFKVSFLNKETHVQESEILSVSFDYWPNLKEKQTYLDENELEEFEYWLSRFRREFIVLSFFIFSCKT